MWPNCFLCVSNVHVMYVVTFSRCNTSSYYCPTILSLSILTWLLHKWAVVPSYFRYYHKHITLQEHVFWLIICKQSLYFCFTCFAACILHPYIANICCSQLASYPSQYLICTADRDIYNEDLFRLEACKLSIIPHQFK